ncbi:MAG: zf-HC2 domain-containing protein [Pseudomonadota bacterium]
MTACKEWEAAISDRVMGEAEGSEQEAFSRHVETCAGCSAELAAQMAFQASLVLPAKPLPGELNAWPKVARELAPTPRRSRSMSFGMAGFLAAAMLVLGVGLGGLMVTNSPVDGPRLVETSVSEEDRYLTFLEEAAPLLLAVTNREVPELVSASFLGSEALAAEQRAAERLADVARGLIDQLEDTGRDREAQLVGELELVFIQVANLSRKQDAGSLQILKAAIDNRGLLFQLTLEELRHLPEPQDGGV